MPGPLVLITVTDPERASDPRRAAQRNAGYAEAVARHGGEPMLVSTGTSADERTAAMKRMGGLLLSGGVDVAPERYGGTGAGSGEIDRDRDELEADAWAAAEARGQAILGICRGLQAINVFSGGRLLEDVGGHQTPARSKRALTHPLRVSPGTRLARILFPTNARGGVLEVNSYHHQGVRPADLAPRLVASATASSPAGELVEALETRDGRFVMGVQCHPERRESTPAAFERVFRVFVDAARGALTSR